MTRRARSLLFILSLLACGSLPLAGLLAALAATNTGAKPLGIGLRGDIDDLVLRNLKLAYRIDTGGTGGVDLSFWRHFRTCADWTYRMPRFSSHSKEGRSGST